MKKHEKALAAAMLKEYAEVLGGRCCNDWEWPEGWSKPMRQAFSLAMEKWNGTPEDYDPKGPPPADFCVAAYLAFLLAEEGPR